MTKNGRSSKAQIEQDARGQSESHHAGGTNATVNKKTPGKGKDTKDWDINYDERDMNEGEFRG